MNHLLEITMIVAGLLSTENEVLQIQHIAKICAVKNRIRYLIRKESIKQLLQQEESMDNTKN